MRRVRLTLLAAASLTIGLLAVAPQTQAASSDPTDFVNSCSQDVSVGTMTCFALRRTTSTGARPNAESDATPGGYGPTDLQSAYQLAASINNGIGQTVYIIDAFDDPTLESDLAMYRSQYGLAPCTVANGCLRKLNQTGATSPLPVANTGWAGEESLDVDMVSASCPNCHITLIEANTNNDSDLTAAITLANNMFGAKIVSMSWGGTADSGDYAFDQGGNFHSGVAYLASSGDKSHKAQWPAVSPGVVSVGGTALTRSASPRGWSETAWFTTNTEGAGSGCDKNEPKPSWQVGQSAVNFCTGRAESDISAVADPNTGVAVYQTFGASGWTIYGGTSASAPLIAGMYALAGGPAAGELPGQTLWTNSPVGSLNDVTSGGYALCTPKQLCQATTGWDGPTGLGTPNGIGALSSTTTPVSVPTTVTGTQVYGGSPTFTGTTSIAGLTASGMHCSQLTTGSLTSATPVGTYTILGSSCTGGATSQPTHFQPGPYVGSTFVVTPAPLVVAPNPLTVPLGTVSPVVSPSYSGFVNGEGAGAAFQTLPVCTIAASPADLPAASYPNWTVCSGASAANYTLTYPRGTVTVAPAGLTVAVTGALINHGAPLLQGVTSKPGVAVSGISCTTADGGTPLASLTDGVHTLDLSSCSGGTLSNPSYTVLGYTGGQFTVAPFGVSVATLPAATIGKAYSGKLTAAGGKAGYAFALVSGQLPPGTRLSAAGAISGTPTLTGTYTATVSVKDSTVPKQTQTWTFSIAVSPLAITAATLPTPVIGKSYNSKLVATSGKATITFAVASGALPSGLKLAAADGITGVPTAPGTFVVVITATDSSTPKVTTQRTFVVTVDPIAVVTTPLPSGTVGTAYAAHLTSTGGKAPLAWVVLSGSLPTGVRLSAAGAFSGTPTAGGTYTFTVRVTDKSVPANTATAVESITVS